MRRCLQASLVLVLCAGFQLGAQIPNFDRAGFENQRAKAETGDADAQWGLGVCFAYGYWVDADAVEAFKWYRKAAEQGLAEAQRSLGDCYRGGEGVAKDLEQAVKWYRKAAEQGHAGGRSRLGSCYFYGYGVEKSIEVGISFWRKAAEGGDSFAQTKLGDCYCHGDGVRQDYGEAVSWYRKAAGRGYALDAQFNLGVCYLKGNGVAKDSVEAVKWFRTAATQNHARAQHTLGICFEHGFGVVKDEVEAVKWYRAAAEQGLAEAQYSLAACYANGSGVPKDYLQAYKWMNLASAQGNKTAKDYLPDIEGRMTAQQIAEAQRLAREFKPRNTAASRNVEQVAEAPFTSSGTGFLISADGFLITNEHVVRDATQIRLVTSAGFISAKVVKVDAANDLALLKTQGKFSALPVAASRGVKLGGTVATVGFPNIGLQGFAPKLAKGEIASLSGAGDDARYFQISVPVQPGNSGGALVDERGNVVGVVSAKLSARAALAASGSLPENVNYAVKSSYLLSFLESVPEVSAKLKEPNTKEKKFEDVVKEAEQAAVLVLVY